MMQRTVIAQVRRHRLALLVLVDSSAWIVALYLGSALRRETWRVAPVLGLRESGGAVPLGGWLILSLLAVALHLTLAAVLKTNRGRHATGSFDEAITNGALMVGVGAMIALINLFGYPNALVARSVPLIATPIAVLLAWSPRMVWRFVVLEPRHRVQPEAKRVIVVGAGDSGRELVRSMLRDDRAWSPQAFVEDNPSRKHLRYLGVPVAGRVNDLLDVARRYGARTAIIALRSLDAAGVRRIYDLATEGGLDVKVLPSVSEMIEGGITVRDVRDVSPEDLLGRRPIDTDVASIASYLTGKRVLVTGAGGSIGSELCRQIQEYAPASLVVLDRDESALHALLLSMYARADLESPNVVLADIREADRMQRVFAEHRPQVVFHAAALKHVNILEQQPAEALKTNVLGTAHVLEAAAEFGVERFVNVSTDKAAAPQNVLGYSKRLAEGLTAGCARGSEGTFLSVRFGNVLGTRGSVLTTFAAQIEAGGPVTVTDPEVTRFFMTVNEAVQLVIQAAAIGRDGEALVLDMGEPVRIIEVARRMIEHSGKDVAIEVTGLKPGEKLHEILLSDGEVDERPHHPLVSHVTVDPVTLSELAGLLALRGPELGAELARACEKMSPSIAMGERSS